MLAGLMVGLFVGASVTAVAQQCFGDGYLYGWTVESMSGEEVCDSPLIFSAARVIECD